MSVDSTGYPVKSASQRDIVLKEGLLKKKSPTLFKGWQERNFRLYSSSLQFSEPAIWQPSDRQIIDLCNVKDVRQSGLCFAVNIEKRSYQLMAGSEEEATSWVAALRKICPAEPQNGLKKSASSNSVAPELAVMCSLTALSVEARFVLLSSQTGWMVIEQDLPTDAQAAVSLLEARVNESESKRVIIIGFPRSIKEAELFEERVVEPHRVLSFGSLKKDMLKVANKYERAKKLREVGGREECTEGLIKGILHEMDKMRERQAQFEAIDKSKTGAIELCELTAMLHAAHKATGDDLLCDSEIARLMDKYDLNGNGKLEFNEFLDFMQEEDLVTTKLAQARAIFDAADTDGSGNLDIGQLGTLLEKIGQPQSADQLDELFRKYDVDRDKGFNFSEYLKFCKETILDLSEIKKALEVVDQIRGRDMYEVDAGVERVWNAEGVLAEALVALVDKYGDDIESFVGSVHGSDFQSLSGTVAKLISDVVKWIGDDPFAKYPSETQGHDVLKEITNTRGWDWKNAEGAKQNSFSGMSDWYTESCVAHGVNDIRSLLVALIQENKHTIDAMSQKFGASYDECIISVITGILTWNSKTVEADQIKKLENPAIFAFSFGTGDKIGPALQNGTKVGPGCETPGKTNEGLAEQVRKILAVRPMPVFAQWEIADALLYGAQGSPHCESFEHWNFSDALEDGDPSKGSEWYSRVEDYKTSSGSTVKVYKSLPIWPSAVKQRFVTEDQLQDPGIMKKYYLSTVGVLNQNQHFWDKGLAKKPTSVICVAHIDHAKRCQKLVKELLLPDENGGAAALGIDVVALPHLSFYPSDWSVYDCDKFGYDPKSTQKWTRTRPLFFAHEATARGMQYVRGDFGPLPIHRPKHTGKSETHDRAFAAHKLNGKGPQLLALLGPDLGWG